MGTDRMDLVLLSAAPKEGCRSASCLIVLWHCTCGSYLFLFTKGPNFLLAALIILSLLSLCPFSFGGPQTEQVSPRVPLSVFQQRSSTLAPQGLGKENEGVHEAGWELEGPAGPGGKLLCSCAAHLSPLSLDIWQDCFRPKNNLQAWRFPAFILIWAGPPGLPGSGWWSQRA